MALSLPESLRVRRPSKLDDLVAAFPLIFFYAALMLVHHSQLRNDLRAIEGPGKLLAILKVLSECGLFLYGATIIVTLLLRNPPSVKAGGIAPRISALFGSFLSLGLPFLHPVSLPLGLQLVALTMTTAGYGLAAVTLFHLKGSFSVMAEARRLVTDGPYAVVRHPLYASEFLYILAAMLQFAQPWAGLIITAQFFFQVTRMRNEETVLAMRFSEYRAYAAHTSRLIPGIY
jgi:protein-S-isoprenylcysteine O-methyltransferase Ste14